MKLEQIALWDKSIRRLLSIVILHDKGYKVALKKGLPFFYAEQLEAIETDSPGLTYREVDQILASKGMILKAPTFKRYVGLKLISGTERIERTEKGNTGYYPATVIRDINFVKYCLFAHVDLKALTDWAVQNWEGTLEEMILQLQPLAFDVEANRIDLTLMHEVESYVREAAKEGVLTPTKKKAILQSVKACEKVIDDVIIAFNSLREELYTTKLPGEYLLRKLSKSKSSEKGGKK